MFSWNLNQQATFSLTAMLPLLLQVGGLAFAVLADVYFERRQKRVFLRILALTLGLILQNHLEVLVCRSGQSDFLRTVLSLCGYILRPWILLLLYFMVEPEGRFRQGWALAGLNTAVYLTALFSPIAFSIRDNGYVGGPLSRTCLVVSLLLMAGLVVLSIRKSRQTRGRALWIPITTVPIILISIYLDYQVMEAEQPVSFLTIAVVESCMLYYLFPHLQYAQRTVKERQERQRMQLMLSQIKPHFLYNTLENIEVLCLTDPQAANRATAKLSEYLRRNLAAISESKLVSLDQELSHARLYLELEQMRFEDALQVEYRIGCTDFFLPPLTLEPLVENAVRHGVRMKPDGRGVVTISSEERPDGWEVSVRDDGPGFDPAVPPADDKPHIGIPNVRERLESCGCSLTITSRPGVGTEATIWVPKDRRIKPC